MIELALAVALSAHDDSRGPRDCLALVVYSEARGEPLLGQIIVAQTVVFRTIAHDTDICTEVLASDQYHGVDQWAVPRQPTDASAWKTARRVADFVIDYGYKLTDYCGQPLYFYSGKRPKWLFDNKVLCVVGDHTFLR